MITMTAADKFNKTIESKNKTRKSYPYKGHHLKHWVYYPLAFIFYHLEKIVDWADNAFKPRWNEKRANRFLNYAAPKRMYFDKQDNSFVLEIVNNNARALVNAARWYDEKWAWYYKTKINQYFIDKFQVSGYEKTVEFWEDEQTTIVKFTKI